MDKKGQMKEQDVLKGIFTIIGLAGIVLAWVFFGWKLVLVMLLVLWANNGLIK